MTDIVDECVHYEIRLKAYLDHRRVPERVMPVLKEWLEDERRSPHDHMRIGFRCVKDVE
jgi:hypothetical protein